MGQNASFRDHRDPRTFTPLPPPTATTVMSLKSHRGWLLPVVLMLTGCHTVLMSPSGDVALQQRNLILTSLVLMLLIIVPVIVMTLLFAWRYRASHKRDDYDPEWDHSTMLELLIWSAPLLIIIALGAVTWVSTHKLDPYHKLERLSAGREVPGDVKPLEIDVVALDWKWLFIYPEQGIATINEVAAPVDRPIRFKITASTVMNSFFVPALAGQIYAMPNMQTTLQAVINKPGDFEGFSANYSGAGFSGMHFVFRGMSDAQFDQWIGKARSGHTLDRAAYLQLVQPSQNDPVSRFAKVSPGLFEAIVNNCVVPGQTCMSDMHDMAPQHTEAGAGHDMPGMTMATPR